MRPRGSGRAGDICERGRTMAFLFLMATATLSSAAPVPTLAGLRGFGSAIYNDATLQWHGKLPGTLFAANETTVLERTLAAPYTGAGQAATMTMLWMLCGKDNMGRFVSDNVIFRCGARCRCRPAAARYCCMLTPAPGSSGTTSTARPTRA